MSGTEGHTGDFPTGDPEGGEAGRAPHRVIGTPPPAEERTLLGAAQPETPAAPRELPADPEDPAAAKRAEKIVAALFILGMLAGIGFIAAYIGLPVGGSVDSVLRSNLALGISMGVAFLALGAGAVIWVRRLMPDVELTEARKPLASL